MTNLSDIFKDKTQSGDANSWDIRSPKKAWVDGVELTGNAYTPAMMQYDGSSGFYELNPFTSAGNKVALMAWILSNTISAGLHIMNVWALTGVRLRGAITTDTTGKILVQTQDSSGTNICLLRSEVEIDDLIPHLICYSFDGDIGAASFEIDAVAQDDLAYGSRVAPTTGTLGTGNAAFHYGCNYNENSFWPDQIGFGGHKEAYISDWSPYRYSDGRPKNADLSAWLIANEHGEMSNNQGTGSNATLNGTIVVGDGGAT